MKQAFQNLSSKGKAAAVLTGLIMLAGVYLAIRYNGGVGMIVAFLALPLMMLLITILIRDFKEGNWKKEDTGILLALAVVLYLLISGVVSIVPRVRVDFVNRSYTRSLGISGNALLSATGMTGERCVVYDSESGLFIRDGLPEQMRPSRKEEIGAVFVLTPTETRTGSYENGDEAYRRDDAINLLELNTGSSLTTGTARGTEPPKTIVRDVLEFWREKYYGERPGPEAIREACLSVLKTACGKGPLCSFMGTWTDGPENGRGAMTFADGSVYEGEWESGRPSGQGKMTRTDGTVREGEWHSGLPSGQWKTTCADGTVYEGTLDENSLTGSGTITWPDGKTYAGEWQEEPAGLPTGPVLAGNPNKSGSKKLIPHGLGTMTYPGECVYSGQWQNGLRSGQGKASYADGGVYEGEWQNGQRSGQGKMTYADGGVYQGGFLLGQFFGQGTLVMTDGRSYNGSWKDGKPFGRGTMVFQDGGVYEGYWLNGQFSGQGKMTYADGDVYEGEWLNGKRCGQGTYIMPDGRLYEGGWKDGQPDGAGLMVYENGTVFDGAFIAGSPAGEGHRTTEFEYVLLSDGTAEITAVRGTDPIISLPDSVDGAVISSVGDAVFSWRTDLAYVRLPGQLRHIGRHAFYKCSSLSKAVLPETLTDIGDSAFFRCGALETIRLPARVTQIGEFAFARCDSLREVTLQPEGALSVGTFAFYDCSRLSLVSAPSPSAAVTVGNFAFYGCKGLSGMTRPDGKPFTVDGDVVFRDMTLICRTCGNPFPFTADEQQFYLDKDFMNEPSNCADCRRAARNQRTNPGAPRIKYDAVCASCGKEFQVIFQPTGDRLVYCDECYQKLRNP